MDHSHGSPPERSSPTDRPGRLAVGLVGAGRAGSVLAPALARAGHRTVALSAVSSASLDRAARRLPGTPIVPPDAVVAAADLALLAVPDDALESLVTGLAEVGAFRPGQLVMHISGAHGLSVLQPAIRAGALPLALHPIMTFSGRDEDENRLTGTHWGVTTVPELRPVGEALVLEMGGEPIWVEDSRRPLYHAALVVAANHLVTLINDAADLLRAAGVEQPALALAPLAGAALDNALRSGDAALTGPVSRGDAGTVAGHLEALRGRQPSAVAGYLAMARRTADRAIAAGRLDPAAAENLLDVLGEHSAST
ncbi:Rossmann-like and DUF2520 domain-containing protein [Cryptosporangium aurantiacum]|uniref:Predicted oxidoreductase, contains short-chain dehydrogenase (SDR) and DUF2520 domains n=1 Tax=Cryptosporangium aurantiacum TaxID=134849 RepID=A0A1M7NB35_9ACTN|nr:DUF2520 domain-containing protein [Cryptosporangium aurantiacum]SHN00850.1 Predicted oxidoreductase, contains short-chain dehydrogenase (SDR) and DUF2520 domains [Cryptosporangium aurantiacum]